jgi:hypothetical protein
MEASIELQQYSNAIEGALCAFDREMEYKIKDDVAIRIIELLLDKYYFKDQMIQFDNDLIKEGFTHINKAIEDDLSKVPGEKLVKTLGVIRFVAKRRSRGGREYLTVINDYVGERIGPGVSVIRRLGDMS